jgi:hypothetical protein
MRSEIEAEGGMGEGHEVLPAQEPTATNETADVPPEEVLLKPLTEEQIEEVVTLLRAGRRLPPYLVPHLFEAPREYHLAYRGKARAVDVLSETMAVPLQAVRTYGLPGQHSWSNMLVFGDNLQVLRHLLNLKEQGELRNPNGSDGVRLCYIDPPFASQREFMGSRSERAYMDRVAGAEFVEHLRKRLVLMRELLADDGSLVVHLDTRKVHYIKVVLDELFGEGNFRNEIVWKRTSAHSDAGLLGSVHETLLFYSKGANPVWNPQYVPYEDWYVEQYYRYRDPDGRRFMSGDIGAAGLAGGGYDYEWKGVRRIWRVPEETMTRLDTEGRIFYTRNGMPRIKRYLDESKGQPLGDLWTDILPVVSWSKERVGYPTQKPVQLLTRIISMASHPGDIVLDAFVGSGTTLVASEELDPPRRWIGIDSGKLAIYTSQARLLTQAGKKAPDRAFTLYNAGLYDYGALRDMPWPRYLQFVLQLFQCRHHEEEVGGVRFHGFLGRHRVLAYDFKEHPEARIGEDFVNDLAALCKGRLGSRCFIIAPAVAVELYEDYVDVGDTRFFFLRIPYSVIAELHKKAFTELRQPQSEVQANAPIDSIGFDFIQPPAVECRYSSTAELFEVEIVAFESEAITVEPSEENITDLAMVLVDYSYDDEVFDLAAVHFAEDLERADWRFSIPKEEAGERVMIIYVDVSGNEHREVKSTKAFKAPAKQPVQTRKAAAQR